MKIKFNYYWEEIRKRSFFIIGLILLIFILSLDQIPILGQIINQGQKNNIFPGDANMANFLRRALIICIFAISWDLLSGYSGQVSFGHALYFGIGGFMYDFVKRGFKINNTTIFTSMPDNIHNVGSAQIDISVIVAICIASFIVMIFGIIISILSLRLKGPYLALVTLVLPLVFIEAISSVWDEYFGYQGTRLNVSGIIVNNPDETSSTKLSYYNYYCVLIFFFISTLIIYSIARSRFGTVLQAIREDEQAAAASGINVNRYKVIVSAISVFFASLAGGLSAQSNGIVSTSSLEADKSFEIIIYSILGGIGTISGPILGTVIIVYAFNAYLSVAFTGIATLDVLSLGIILIIVLRFQPYGLVRASKQVRNALLFATFWTITMAFNDIGLLIPSAPKELSTGWFMQKYFSSGFMSIDVTRIEGLMVFNFIIGIILGYYGPELLKKIRLKIWGVWPSIGNFDPTR